MNKIQLLKGDITKIAVDAIVNAANKSSLMGGGGVDGAIHRAGGKQILEECKLIAAKQGGCETGEAVITTARKTACKIRSHILLARYGKGGNKNVACLKLSACYSNSLYHLAAQYGCKKEFRFPI